MNLSVSLVPGALTLPVLAAGTSMHGIDLALHRATSVDENSRRMLNLEFDIGEMSLATYVQAREQGVPLIALPVFTGLRFLQAAIGFRPSAELKTLEDLVGRRVGVLQFWMTSSVWHRAILKRLFAIDQSEITWITVRPERLAGLAFPERTT